MLSLEKQLILGSKSFFISVKPVNDWPISVAVWLKGDLPSVEMYIV
jgi:hypothetical protein